MDIELAVALTAGEGERLRPLTTYRPMQTLPTTSGPVEAAAAVAATEIDG